MRNWKILKWADRPEITTTIEYHCTRCGKDANLAVAGIAMAQIGEGVFFDTAHYSMPDAIECPNCRKRLEVCDVR
jgi:DNA-directed RNA polymerase subunit RPC12/RpoP